MRVTANAMGVLGLVGLEGAHFDAVNVATAMHRLAKLKPPNVDLILQDPRFDRLTGK